MGTAPASATPDSLALVSSLYGPGTIACWYFTTLSVLVSWTIHPQKRKSGSIDVDLLAVLTLAAVAAGHLLSQVPRPLNYAKDERNLDDTALLYSQLIAAFEAPLVVVETFVMLSAVLFLVAAWMICIRRAIAVGLVGLVCFVVDCYIHFSQFSELNLWHNPFFSSTDPQFSFSRLFVATFGQLLIILMILLVIYVLSSIAIAVYLQPSSKPSPSSAHLGLESTELSVAQSRRSRREVRPNDDVQDEVGNYTRNENRRTRWIKNVSILLHPVAVWVNLGLLSSNSAAFAISITTQSSGQMLTRYIARFGSDFFPNSAYSITDLDQGVAAAAGATVLTFNIYSVAKSCYKNWRPYH